MVKSLLFLAPILFLSGCQIKDAATDVAQNNTARQKHAEKFLLSIQAKQYTSAWKMLDPSTKKVNTTAQFTSFFQKMGQTIGPIKSWSATGWDEKMGPSPYTVFHYTLKGTKSDATADIQIVQNKSLAVGTISFSY